MGFVIRTILNDIAQQNHSDEWFFEPFVVLQKPI